MAPPHFLPLSPKIGGLVNNNRPSTGQYLAREHAKKTEFSEMINTDTLQQKIEHERHLNKIDNNSRDTNPYREFIVNNAQEIEPLLAQMEQWSILSNTLNYIQYDKHQKHYPNLGISAVNTCKNHLDVQMEEDMTELFEVGFSFCLYL